MPDTIEVPDLEEETMLMDLDVPPVRARDPDPEAGPRLNVKEFRIQGIVEYPELGITRKELINRVEAIRFDIMGEGRRTESGFTLDELAQMGDLFIEIEKNTQDRHVGTLELQKFVFLVREQLRKRGVTLGMIETVADTITQYYRERGFILAKAFIPEQKVRDGVVNLTLLLGTLGDVNVEDSKRASPKLIERVFNSNLEKPVTSWELEEDLFLVNDIPGLSAQGYLSPGLQVGDTRLTVKVQEEKWYSANLRLDNHGAETTSRNRAYGDFYLHNPLGWGDQLYFAVLQSYLPSESTYGAVRYNSFIYTPRVRGSIGFSTNEFFSRNVRQESAPELTGTSSVADAALSYYLARGRKKNYSVELKYMDVDTEIDSQGLITSSAVEKVSLALNFDVLSDKRKQVYVGNVTLHHADTIQGGGVLGANDSDIVATNDFVSAELTVLSFLELPLFKSQTRVLAKSALQYAGAATSNLNQISLAGPSRARAFAVNGFQADDGLYLGADWIFNAPKFGGLSFFGKSFREVVQPYLFFDFAAGILHLAEEDIDTTYGRLANIGAGLKLQYGNFSANIFAAAPLEDDIKTIQAETPTTNLSLEMQYRF